MRAVNLLPADRRAGKGARLGLLRSRALVPATLAVTFAAVAALVFAVLSATSGVTNKQQQLDALQSRIASLPQPSSEQTQAAASAAAAAPRRTTLVTLAGDRLPWDEFLGSFARVVPEDVWLSTMQASSPGAAETLAEAQAAAAAAQAAATSATSTTTTTTTTTTTPAPAAPPPSASTFTITGFTYSQPEVARLMRRLALIPWLSDVDLVSTSQTTIGKSTVVQFTVGATVVPTGVQTP